MRGPVLPYLFCRPLKPIWIARQRDIIALPGKFLDGGAADAAPAPVITATFAMFIFLNMMFNEWPRRLVPRRPLNHAPSDDIAAQMKVADRLRRAARAQSYDGIAMRCARLAIIQMVPATMMVSSNAENKSNCKSSRFVLKKICRKKRKCTSI